MSAITTHVLDTARGKPAAEVPVTLARLDEANNPIATYSGVTDSDGRVADLLGRDALVAGEYRISFDTGAYAASNGEKSFYPHVEITFTIESPQQHYHVPLLLSPYGYSTYRGS